MDTKHSTENTQSVDTCSCDTCATQSAVIIRVKGNILKDKESFFYDVVSCVKSRENVTIIMSKMQDELYYENVNWIFRELINKGYGVYFQQQRCSEKGCVSKIYYVTKIPTKKVINLASIWIDECYQCEWQLSKNIRKH